MAEIHVEPYLDEDKASIIEAIIDLQEFERSLADTRRPGSEIAEPYFEQIRHEVAEKSGAWYVAKVDGVFAGHISCWVEHDDQVAETVASNIYGYISDAYVRPEFRGMGVFPALNAKVEEFFRGQKGIELVRLNTLALNARAIRAYEKAGYAPEEVILVKRLSSS